MKKNRKSLPKGAFSKNQKWYLALLPVLAITAYALQYLIAFALPAIIQGLQGFSYIFAALVSFLGILPFILLGFAYEKFGFSWKQAALGFVLLAILPAWQIWGQSFLLSYLIGSIVHISLLGSAAFFCSSLMDNGAKGSKFYGRRLFIVLFLLLLISGPFLGSHAHFVPVDALVSLPYRIFSGLVEKIIQPESGIAALLHSEISTSLVAAYFLLLFTQLLFGKNPKLKAGLTVLLIAPAALYYLQLF
jgi:hypothetical protein